MPVRINSTQMYYSSLLPLNRYPATTNSKYDMYWTCMFRAVAHESEFAGSSKPEKSNSNSIVGELSYICVYGTVPQHGLPLFANVNKII